MVSTSNSPASSPAAWLTTLHSNGVDLAMDELMYYHSKLGAFARHARSKPPRGTAGGILSKHKGRGMEFDEVRHYQAGDDIRAIDWRVTARTGSPHTKLFREEQERPVFIVTDLSLTQFFGTQLLFKSVQSCHLAAALAWQAQQRGDRVGGLIGNGFSHIERRPQARQQSVLQYLHGLLEVHQQSLSLWQQQTAAANQQPMLVESAQRLLKLAKPGSEIYFISDFANADEQFFRLCRGLKQHCQVQAFLTHDPFEQALPSSQHEQQLLLSDGHQRQQINLASPQQVRQYQQQAEIHFAQVQQQFEQMHIQLRSVSAAEPLEQQWQDIMV